MEQRRRAAFEEVGGALEDRGALARRRRVPLRSLRRVERAVDVLVGRVTRRPDDGARVGGRCIDLRLGGRAFDAEHRLRRERALRLGIELRSQLGEHVLVREVDAGGIAPVRVDRRGLRKVRMRLAAKRLRDLDRVGHEPFKVDVFVGHLVDERRIGAVLEQPPHEIGEERAVRSDRRVDAARQPEVLRADDVVVERLAHAVQALELEAFAIARELEHGRERARVVRRELREQEVAMREQPARAREVGDVGVDLARVHRIIGEALDLRALDLAVPVRSLDEAQRHAPPGAPRELDRPVDDVRRALLVGLDDDAEPVPAGERRVVRERVDQVERKLEAIGFLGVDREPDVVVLRKLRERGEARQQLVQHAVALRAAVARVQRGELHRQTGCLHDATPVRDATDGVQRLGIRGFVADRVGGGHRRLAQHVVRIAVAARFALAGPLQRGFDRLAEHELLAEEAHRRAHGGADHRLPDAGERFSERAFEHVRIGRRGNQPAGDHEPPARGVDEERIRRMRAPVAATDLVADQRVRGSGVGNAQQRLGEAHERDAFLGRERERLHERVGTAAFAPRVAHLAREVQRERVRALAARGVERRLVDDGRNRGRLVDAGRRGDAVPKADLLACKLVALRRGSRAMHRFTRCGVCKRV